MGPGEPDAERGERRFLGRLVPASFVHRVVTIPAGRSRAYDADEWRDAIVVVECGEVELEALDGACHRFGTGTVMWLDDALLRWIRSVPGEETVLVAVSRRPAGVSALPDRRRP